MATDFLLLYCLLTRVRESKQDPVLIKKARNQNNFNYLSLYKSSIYNLAIDQRETKTLVE